MRIVQRCLLCGLILGLAAGVAAAQVVSPVGIDRGWFPRVEVGGQVGLSILAGGGDGAVLLGSGGRLGVNLTRRDALEVLVEPSAGFEDGGINGLYFVQYKRMLRDRVPGRAAPFVVASFGSDFRYDRVPEFRMNRPDGSSVVYPSHTESRLHAPKFGGGGIGVEHIVGRYIAARAEVQGLIFSGGAGIRASAGLTIPIGGFYARLP